MRDGNGGWFCSSCYERQFRIRIIRILAENNTPSCKKCGYNEDIRALHIDHINGGGNKERGKFRERCGSPHRDILKFYLKQPEHELRKKFQILCAICNWLKWCDSNLKN